MPVPTEHFIPRPWGRIATRFLLDNPRGMLVEDPGMGKTSQVLSALDLLQMGGSGFFPALVLAPKRVAETVWDGEARKWDAFAHFRIEKVMGTEEERLAALRRPVADIYIANYDVAPWLVAQFGGGDRWPFKIVVADESSRLKGFRLNKGRVRAEALSQIAKHTGRWWNLTGTPSPNGLQDLWGQFWFVDFGVALKRTYSAFLEAYCREDPYTRHISVMPGCDQIIHQQLKDKMLVLRAEDWLPLEKPQEIPVPVQLDARSWDLYRRMEREYFIELGDGAIEAKTAAIKSSKLLQMVSGSIYDEDSTTHHLHDAKIEALESIVEESGGEPLLVSYWWKFDVVRIRKAFPEARVYAGPQDEADFNEGRVPMLLLHAQSAFGLSLHKVCRDIVFYSYNWNAELWQQMIERVGPTRQAQAGRKCVVRIWTVRARGTIESDVIDSNMRKISIEQALKRARARRQHDQE